MNQPTTVESGMDLLRHTQPSFSSSSSPLTVLSLSVCVGAGYGAHADC